MGCVITQTRHQAFQTLCVLKARLSVSRAWLSLSEARPHVLKQMLGRVFRSTDTLGVLSNNLLLSHSSFSDVYYENSRTLESIYKNPTLYS